MAAPPADALTLTRCLRQSWSPSPSQLVMARPDRSHPWRNKTVAYRRDVRLSGRAASAIRARESEGYVPRDSHGREFYPTAMPKRADGPSDDYVRGLTPWRQGGGRRRGDAGAGTLAVVWPPPAERAEALIRRRDESNRARAILYADAACAKRWVERAGGVAGVVAGHDAAQLEAAVRTCTGRGWLLLRLHG